MLKLYICYFVFGALMLFYSLSACFFTPDGLVAITNLALYSSLGIFLVIPPLVLYWLKYASIAGLVLVACVLPFSGYWLWYRFVQHGVIIGGPSDLTILIMAILLALVITYSIKYMLNPNARGGQIKIRKAFRLMLALLPTALITTEFVLMLMDKA